MMWPGVAFAWHRHDVACAMARVGHVACGDVWFVAVLLGMTHCMSQSPIAGPQGGKTMTLFIGKPMLHVDKSQP